MAGIGAFSDRVNLPPRVKGMVAQMPSATMPTGDDREPDPADSLPPDLRSEIDQLAAQGGLPYMAELVRRAGEVGSGGKDSILAHIMPEEAIGLYASGGSGRVDPETEAVHFESDASYMPGWGVQPPMFPDGYVPNSFFPTALPGDGAGGPRAESAPVPASASATAPAAETAPAPAPPPPPKPGPEAHNLATFDWRTYLRDNPAAKEAHALSGDGSTPAQFAMEHYNSYGRKEGQTAPLLPSTWEAQPYKGDLTKYGFGPAHEWFKHPNMSNLSAGPSSSEKGGSQDSQTELATFLSKLDPSFRQAIGLAGGDGAPNTGTQEGTFGNFANAVTNALGVIGPLGVPGMLAGIATNSKSLSLMDAITSLFGNSSKEGTFDGWGFWGDDPDGFGGASGDAGVGSGVDNGSTGTGVDGHGDGNGGHH